MQSIQDSIVISAFESSVPARALSPSHESTRVVVTTRAGCISNSDKSVTDGSLFPHVATIVRDDRPCTGSTLQGSSPHLS